MSYPIIDKKTQRVKFGHWPLQERIKTTLQLVSLGNNHYDIYYSSQFKGIKEGKIEKIEIPHNSYITTRINDNPEIRVEIINCSCTDGYIAIHVKISAEIRALGNKVIYDQVLDNYNVAPKRGNIKLKGVLKYFKKINEETSFASIKQEV
ncbi:hypothetical protein D1816_11235 [Aquimarina sp. AD10]|uniref:hypothetical protein n=1 Tax=Aquimarina TaxID=290174 RepID=UPI000E4DA9DE|nr:MULTISPECIES: hypothetical protein [Aquimarina]AXT60895.1 hypothetical protein D1816_11235 [Aquimarina sp. AD10]RKM93028.1 hypothetical protein D7033_20210 [Aquimarina sp. AD10]